MGQTRKHLIINFISYAFFLFRVAIKSQALRESSFSISIQDDTQFKKLKYKPFDFRSLFCLSLQAQEMAASKEHQRFLARLLANDGIISSLEMASPVRTKNSKHLKISQINVTILCSCPKRAA